MKSSKRAGVWPTVKMLVKTLTSHRRLLDFSDCPRTQLHIPANADLERAGTSSSSWVLACDTRHSLGSQVPSLACLTAINATWKENPMNESSPCFSLSMPLCLSTKVSRSLFKFSTKNLPTIFRTHFFWETLNYRNKDMFFLPIRKIWC